MSPLHDVYGNLPIVRPPVPATCNKAGANYKSEVTHLDYSPRRAYDEWLTILDGIVACGGDALYQFEAVDEPSSTTPRSRSTAKVRSARSARARCSARWTR